MRIYKGTSFLKQFEERLRKLFSLTKKHCCIKIDLDIFSDKDYQINFLVWTAKERKMFTFDSVEETLFFLDSYIRRNNEKSKR